MVAMAEKRLHFGRLDGGSATNNDAAIVFIHGFTGDWRKTWGRIPEFLRPSLANWDLYGFGYESNRRFDLLGFWSADASISIIADMLYTKSINELRGYKALAFVAHSMGGLVAQQALTTRDDLRQRLSHVFLFGTPSAGLAKADKLSFLKQQVENMRDKSPFITDLRKRWTGLNLDTQAGFRFLATAGEIDQFVPPESSILPFPEALRRVVPGNHVSMLDVASGNDPTVTVLREGFTSGAAGRDSARVAVESGEFQKLVQQFWPAGKAMPQGLDDSGSVQLAIALDQVGRREDAIELLRSRQPRGTDALGVLAGRLKRRWLVTRSENDYQAARDLYRQAYEQARAATPPDHDQAYYHGINLAFLVLAQEGNFGAALEDAQQLARQILEHCRQAKDARYLHWRLATEGDALNILGEWEQGVEKHRQAVAQKPPPREMVSMEEQAVRIARLAGHAKDNLLATIYEGPDT
jgi:pimeloyl-ACP methyl ester carboxylesterase